MGAPWAQIAQEVGQTVHALENAGLSAISNAKAESRADVNYSKQRHDYILDREHEEWYNSPEQQIRRLKQAGLNPNLVYGTGASAGVAGSPQSTKQNAPASSFINAMQDTNFVDNLVKMGQLELQRRQMDDVHSLNGARLIEQGERNKRLMRDNLLDNLNPDLMPNTYAGYTRMQKAGIMNYQRLGSYQTYLLRKQEADLQKAWKRYGVTGNDSFFVRAGAKAFHDSGIGDFIGNIIGNIGSMVSSFIGK